MRLTKTVIYGAALSLWAGSAYAAPVTGWIAANSQNGAASPKALTGANTSSPTIGDGAENGATSGAGQIALYADINGTIDGASDIALANGRKVTLTGSVNLIDIVSSQEQFRWGLFYEGAAPFDASGWLGYSGHNSAGGSGGALRAKVSGNTDVFAANGTAVNLQTAQDGDAFNSGTYNFSMSVSKIDNDLTIDATLTNGTTFTQSWKSAMPTNPNQVTYNFNRVGFLSGNTMSPNQLVFSNIDVTEAPADALTLQVATSGPDVGRVKIKNNTASTYNIEYYEIDSANGLLSTANWNSLDDQETGDAETVGWDEAFNSSSTILSEVRFHDSTAVGPSGLLNLGKAFTNSGTPDLKFFYGLPDGTFARGIVEYVVGNILAGDYNDNGVVDAADYAIWRDHNNTNHVLPNDTTSGTVNSADYDVWKANFGKTSGSGSVLASLPAPEPTTLVLITLGAMLAAMPWRGRAVR